MSSEIQKRSDSPIRYPMQLLRPVAAFLSDQLRQLKSRRQLLRTEDPFSNSGRIQDNAAPDADAEEQFGHATVVAIKRRIDIKIVQTRRALARIKIGKYGMCEKCGNMIDTDRLMVFPEATLCISCETKKERTK